MVDANDPTMSLIYLIDDLVLGDCPQDEIDRVMDQAEGYRFQMRCSGCEHILNDRTRSGLSKLRGWLAGFVTTCSSGQTSITNTNTATATASSEVTFSNVMSQVWSLPEDTLDSVQKQELAAMLQEFENAKGGDDGKLVRAGKAIADWLFENSVKALPTVIPYIVQAIQCAVGG